MNEDYLIVHKKAVPAFFEKVLECRRLLETGEADDVSDAVRQTGISRSTYDKYKVLIFSPDLVGSGRKAVISMLLNHEIGVLSNALNRLSAMGVNVLTISQNLPIHHAANVVMTLDIAQMNVHLETALSELSAMEGVSNVSLVSLE